MGKGTILGGGKDGLYLLNVDYGDQKRQQLVQAIDRRLTEVDAAILTATTNLANEQVKIDDAETALNSSIAALEQAVTANPNADHTALLNDVKAKTDEYQKAAAKRRPFAFALETVKAEKANLISKRNYLADLNLIKTFPAWCADFTENATGQVATIEVPGEPRTVIIAPGAPAPTAANGTVQAREVMTPEQAFMNASLLPGWQKWKPTFRTGVITSISGNTCSVNLKYEESSAATLKINQTTNLTNVPIQYMDCNGTAFSKNDEVIVRFDGQDWKYPKVVGFVKEPKQCAGIAFNGGVYRKWGIYGNDNQTNPSAPWVSTELILRAPLSIHSQIYNANENDIIFTVSNPYWGTVPLTTFTNSYYGFRSFMPNFGAFPGYFYKTKTILDNFNQPINVTEELEVSFGDFLQDENSLLYEYTVLAPCNENYIYVRFYEDVWGEKLSGHPLSYWNSRLNAPFEWDIYFAISGKVIFDGTLTTNQQPLPTYALSDAFVCTYAGPYTPSVPWKWVGSGLSIPQGVTWITT